MSAELAAAQGLALWVALTGALVFLLFTAIDFYAEVRRVGDWWRGAIAASGWALAALGAGYWLGLAR